MAGGIWNRHSDSICHCGEPYQTESEPNTIRSSPMNFKSCPRMWAAIVGKVTTDEAHVVPISAMQFGRSATSWAYSVVQLMFGTPPRSFSALTSSKESARKKFG